MNAGSAGFIGGSANRPRATTMAYFWHISPYCRSRDMRFLTKFLVSKPFCPSDCSTRVRRRVQARPSIWSIGILGAKLGRRLHPMVHRADVAQMCSPHLRLFFNRFSSSSCAIICFVAHIRHGVCPAQGFSLCLISVKINDLAR